MSDGPVAIVTGGGTGIGAATTVSLRKAGWEVVICGRRAEPLERVAAATGALPLVADAATQPGIDLLLATTLGRFGALHGLVLNAGIVRPGSVGDLDPEDWDAMVLTNLSGPFRMLRSTIPHLTSTRGSVVGVASAAALRATGGIAGYNATKAALAMLMQTVAVDYGPVGIRANAVCPGWTRTEMADGEMAEYGSARGLTEHEAYEVATSFVPARRPAHADEVADVITWLMSPRASYVNGAVLPIDGGMIAVDPGSISFDQRSIPEFRHR